MHIVHVINSLGTGGAETLVVELAAGMAARGHEVRIVTIGPQEGIPYERASALQLKIVQVGRSAYDVTSILRLRKALEGADVVHVHLFPSLYFAPLALSSSVPIVYTEHSTWNRRRNRTLFRWADRHFYRKYDALVAISGGVKDSLAGYLSTLGIDATPTIVPNGISDVYFDAERRRVRDPGSRFRLIAVGTLDERKNFSDAICAVAEMPGLELSIVGDGHQRDELRALIESRGLGDRVRLMGQQRNVARLMDQHDALISTSRYEGFSLVAAEAMALGLPVIGPNVAGFKDSVTDEVSGLLFDQSGGLSSIVASISRLLTEPGLYRRLSQGAIERSEKFRMTASVTSYLSTYSRVLD